MHMFSHELCWHPSFRYELPCLWNQFPVSPGSLVLVDLLHFHLILNVIVHLLDHHHSFTLSFQANIHMFHISSTIGYPQRAKVCWPVQWSLHWNCFSVSRAMRPYWCHIEPCPTALAACLWQNKFQVVLSKVSVRHSAVILRLPTAQWTSFIIHFISEWVSV